MTNTVAEGLFLLALLVPLLAVLTGVLLLVIKAPDRKASEVRAHAAPAAR
jgi:hypothetical protein